ncbi:Sulfide:quinone oxidoreductase, mitochondrial [Aphelenchoides besseyi]|nr:Sulfide:quinone oxidoreductase, mitochondrial [Aphelenchoides besseyi]
MKLSTKLLKSRFKDHYKLLVCGSGAGGSSIASYFSRCNFDSAIIEPNEEHHYQPGYTLLASGLVEAKKLVRKRQDYLPKGVDWYKNSVEKFHPKENAVELNDGVKIHYDYLVIATGIQLRYDLGLSEAFDTPGVCSIYRYDLAKKTWSELRTFAGGTALFTYPNTPIKCAGAPQKIAYLAEDIFRERKVRDKSVIIYNTTIGKIFGVEKYRKVLDKIIQEKGIIFNGRHNLFKVDAKKRIAYFEILDDSGNSTGKQEEIKFLHVAPPCSPVLALRNLAATGDPLTDEKGWVDVSHKTLQSKTYPNIFALGDCISAPCGKTAAAVSSQFNIVKHNLLNFMNQKPLNHEYDGYASCPLLVDRKHVVLAEFNYKGPLETLPFNQAKPRYIQYLMKAYLMPFIYWRLLLKGRWNGPSTVRKLLHLGFGNRLQVVYKLMNTKK